MAREDDRPVVPARVQAALEYLRYCYWKTEQSDVSIPPMKLSTTERSVESAALSILQQYFLGEMDFGDAPPITVGRSNEDDNGDGVCAKVS